jgi:hypothetical protein
MHTLCLAFQKNNLGWVFTNSVLELSSNNMVHTHMILGIMNLTNSTNNIAQNIKNIIRIFSSNDIKIEFLEKFINTKRV